MKLFDQRYIFFVLIFFAVLVVDFIFFVGLKIPELLDFALPAVIAMIGFFVIIPIAVAYQISFKLRKNSSKELGIKKINKKVVIGISVLLALFVFLIIPKGSVKFEPYTFYPVTDQEFKKPLKIIATKKIGENEYYLKETEAVGVSLYQKVGDDSQADKFIFDLPALIDSKSAADFWYDNLTNTAVVIVLKGGYLKGRYEQIFKYSLNAKGQKSLQVLKTSSVDFYSREDKILDYFSETDTLLIETSGGDSCGWKGEIWLLRGTETRTLQDINSGCFPEALPRFVGYDGKFLYFAIFQSVNFEGELGLKEIFKINSRTGGKTTVINANLPENVVKVELSEDQKTIIMRTDKNKEFTLDLEQNYKIKEASSSPQIPPVN